MVISPMPKNVFRDHEIQSTADRIREILRQNDIRVVKAHKELPKSVSEIPESRMIIEGAPFSVYEQLQWIEQLKDLILEIRKAGKPLLGSCFGHQCICASFGAKVERAPKAEFGIYKAKLTEEGKKDPLFEGVDLVFSTIQTHGDKVVIPPENQDIRVLASTEDCPVQAVAIGENIRAVQFHPEMRRFQMSAIALLMEDRIEQDIFKGDRKAMTNFFTSMIEKHGEKFHPDYPKAKKTGIQILRNFLKMTAKKSA